MPNWCDNKLEITGNSETLNEIAEFVEGENGVFDFNKIVPQPEFENDTDWYHWRLANWDTKWNADGPMSDMITEDRLEYQFMTAWSPSLEVSRKLSEKFPRAYITHWYEEMGMDFSGYTIFKEGEILHEVEGDFDDYWRYFTDDGEELLDRHLGE